jgi:cytochrome c oxidase subunit 2
MAGLANPQAPLSYLQTYGPRADPVTSLGWGLLALSCGVCVIVALLVVIGVLLRRQRGAPRAETSAPERRTGGLAWIYAGLALTVVALTASLAWTVAVVAAVNAPRTRPGLTIEVTGHQWWWQVAYDPDDPSRRFITANEIHVPVGQPVEVKLRSADVIHSFWIPALSGKTDTIPGRTNVTWLQADRPGVYWGQCAEFCGVQHAGMALEVVAEPPATFAAWAAAQRQPATDAPGSQALAGQALFSTRCGACHSVRGTGAGGAVGPDLTHLMSRRTLAAGALPNTPLALRGWIANPQAIKPGARMPPTWLSGPELNETVAYLETLK